MDFTYTELSPLKPVLRANWRRKRLVVVSPSPVWGSLLTPNAAPDFDLMTYSFDGSEATELCTSLPGYKGHFSFVSEMWGESLHKLFPLIPAEYEVVQFLNSDIFISYAEINKFFDYVDMFALDVSQPALSLNSFYSLSWLLKKTSIEVEPVPFVEGMMPCLSRAVIDELVRIGLYTISGWGIDQFLFQIIVERLKLRPQAVVHAVTAVHTKPVESSEMRFSNGMNADEERNALGLECQRLFG
jgi:hypothetical protein